MLRKSGNTYKVFVTPKCSLNPHSHVIQHHLTQEKFARVCECQLVGQQPPVLFRIVVQWLVRNAIGRREHLPDGLARYEVTIADESNILRRPGLR